MRKLLSKLGKWLYLRYSDQGIIPLTRELLKGVQPEAVDFLNLEHETQKDYIDEAKVILQCGAFEYVYQNLIARQRDEAALSVQSLQEMDFARATMNGVNLFKQAMESIRSQGEPLASEVDDSIKFKPL